RDEPASPPARYVVPRGSPRCRRCRPVLQAGTTYRDVRITDLSWPIAAAAAAALCVAALASGASASTVHCAAASTGPGSLHRGGTAGAHCMLAEYRDHCHNADYVLSSFGVDTVH